MTRAHALQRLSEATYDALSSSEAFAAAVASLEAAGVLEPVDISIRLTSRAAAPVDPRADDAAFLRSPHIEADLEAR
jgi:hypothetical protein